MPCNSDYMEASGFEIAMSQVLMLLREAQGKGPVDSSSSEWRGYHDRVYNKAMTKAQANRAVSDLCELIGAMSPDELRSHSLEMQMWWRDHQRADAARIRKEAEAQQAAKVKKEALGKLTAAEREALGIR